MGMGVVGVYSSMDGPSTHFPVRSPYQLKAEWGIPRPRCAPGCVCVGGGGLCTPPLNSNCFHWSPSMGDGIWWMGPKFGQGYHTREESVRVGRGPHQISEHRQPTSWVIDIVPTRVRDAGSFRGPAPARWRNLPIYPPLCPYAWVGDICVGLLPSSPVP